MVDYIELKGQVLACTICRNFLPKPPKPIFQFHPSATILIAGQAPGRVTHEKGIPFDDVSGVRLREWLGISSESFYNSRKIALLPLGFCYPGTGKGGDLPPRPECAANWRTPLMAKLPNLKLTLVIGRYAMQWHLNVKNSRPITEVIKDWRNYAPTTYPLPHPSPRNNRWLRNNPWFESTLLPELRDVVALLI